MRKVLLAVILGFAITGSTASAVPPSTTCPPTGCEITVHANVVKTNRDPRPPRGLAGDGMSQRLLIHSRKGKVIGDLILDCRWVTSSLRLCVGQLSMPLGVIGVMGASRTSFIAQMLIAGGTGLYARANGTLLFTATNTGGFELTLTYMKTG